MFSGELCTSITGAFSAYRAQSLAGSSPFTPRIGPHRAESSWLHTRCRVDCQPENWPPSNGELAAIAIIVGPRACANRTRAAQPSCGPASRLTCTDAVDVIIAAPASPVWLAVKNCSIARYRSPGFTRLAGRSGSAPTSTRPRPACANAARSTARSAVIAAMAATGPSIGGPDNSTAPPGSTVIALPPGSGGTPAMASVSSSQSGRRIGSVRSKQCASTSRPTRPTGPSARQVWPMCSAALYALVNSAVAGCHGCASSTSGVTAKVMSSGPFRVGNDRGLHSIFQSAPTKSRDFWVTRW